MLLKCEFTNIFFTRSFFWIFLFTAAVVESVSKIVPRFTEPSENITVAVGRDATISCTVDDLKSYQMAWIKVDSQTIISLQTKVITHDDRIRVSHSNYKNWFLHIKGIQYDDRGFYMCQINTKPMRHQVIYLDVVVPPDIIDDVTNSDIVVREFGSLHLQCKASGYPHPRIEWQREDGRKIKFRTTSGRKIRLSRIEGSNLTVSKVTREFMGAYLCVASNGVRPSVSKMINVYVNFNPKIRVKSEIIGASTQTDVTLECQVEAFPSPMTSWKNEKNGLIVSSNRFDITILSNGYKIITKLRIKNLKKEDFQKYTCSATNILGADSGTMKIYEILSPVTSTMVSSSTKITTIAQVANTKSNFDKLKSTEVNKDPRSQDFMNNVITATSITTSDSYEEFYVGNSFVNSPKREPTTTGESGCCDKAAMTLPMILVFSASIHHVITLHL